jgi:hypothetical protein
MAEKYQTYMSCCEESKDERLSITKRCELEILLQRFSLRLKEMELAKLSCSQDSELKGLVDDLADSILKQYADYSDCSKEEIEKIHFKISMLLR